MKNFPFLATPVMPVSNTTAQNALLKNAGNNTTQNPPETSNGFKQIFSQQVKQDASKVAPTSTKATQVKPPKNAAQPDRSTQAKQTHQVQDSAAKQNSPQSQAANNDATQVDMLIEDLGLPVMLADTTVSVTKGEDAEKLAEMTESEESSVLPLMINMPIVIQNAPSMVTQANADHADALPGMNAEFTAVNATVKLDTQENQSIDPNINAKQPMQSDMSSRVPADFSAQLGRSVTEKMGMPMDNDVNVQQQQVASVMTTPALTSLVNQANVAQMQAGSSNMIQAYPGKAGWDQAIGQKVVWMVGAEVQSATLTLNPPDLGPLQVVISVNNEKADTTFISDNPDVRKALEEGISSLRDTMEQAGIQLGQANVNTGRQHQEMMQTAKEFLMNQGGQKSVTSQTEQVPALKSIRPTVRVSNGLVDTFA